MKRIIAYLLVFASMLVYDSARPAAQLIPGRWANPSFTGQARFSASTCPAPSITETGALTTGIAFTATPSVLLCVNGTAVLTSTATAYTSTVPFIGPDGTKTSPAYRGSDADTGMYFAANLIKFSVNDTDVVRFSGTVLDLSTDASELRFGASNDVSLSRGAANRLDLASGDSFYVTSGGLGVGVTPPAAGKIEASDTVKTTAGFVISTRVLLSEGGASGKLAVTDTAGTTGGGLDFTSNGVVGIRNYQHNANAQLYAASVRGVAVTVANLPASPVEGMLVAVTDSNTTTWGATIAGGSTNHVLAYYNGTNWTVAGK